MNKPHPHLQEAPKIQPATGKRLDSWKEIAGYLKRDVRTVQRWEGAEGLPVYRLQQGRIKHSPVYAFTSEIDAWLHKNPPPPTEQAVPAKSRRIWLALAAAGIIAAGALFLWLRHKTSGAEEPGVDPARVVVAAFENRTGNSSLDGLGQRIADSINNALIMGVKEVKTAASPAGSGSMEFRRLAALANSGLIVAGAYYLREGQVELQAKIVDPWAENNILCAFEPIPGPAPDPANAIDQLCQRVAGALAFRFAPGGDSGAFTPPRLDAFREFEIGRAAFDANYGEVMQRFQKALSIDPEFHVPRFMMFHGLYNLNKRVQAEAQLTILEARQSRMTTFECQYVRSCRALLEGRLLELLDFTRDLVRRAPKHMTFIFLQGLYAIWVNQPLEAIKSLETIPVDWIPLGGPRAWASLHLAQACHLAGNFERQYSIAKERSVLFPDVLDLNGQQAMALAALGRLDGIDRVIDSCLAIAARPGSGTPASVMADLACELRVHGHRQKAVAVGERAISWLRSRSPEEQKQLRFQLGQLFYLNGNWQRAAQIFRELARESPQDINYQGYLGALAVRQGNRTGAERIVESLRVLDGQYLYGLHTYCRARIASLLGEKEKAVALLRDAFAQGYRFTISVHRDPDFEPLRDYPPYQELLRPKG